MRAWDLFHLNLFGLDLWKINGQKAQGIFGRRLFDLCGKRDIAIVMEDSDEYPSIDADTASFRYARFQRMREELPTGYSEPELGVFAKRIGGWAEDGRDCYIYLINGAKVRAPAAALALQERLG